MYREDWDDLSEEAFWGYPPDPCEGCPNEFDYDEKQVGGTCKNCVHNFDAELPTFICNNRHHDHN